MQRVTVITADGQASVATVDRLQDIPALLGAERCELLGLMDIGFMFVDAGAIGKRLAVNDEATTMYRPFGYPGHQRVIQGPVVILRHPPEGDGQLWVQVPYLPFPVLSRTKVASNGLT